VNLCKNILINAKLKTGKRGKINRADWEKSITEAKVRSGLWCHLRRRKRRRREGRRWKMHKVTRLTEK
jgi:hypothetical protein